MYTHHYRSELLNHLLISKRSGYRTFKPLFTYKLPIKRSHTMSFQAYLDNIEEKTGKTPNDFIAMAKEKGFDNPKTKAGDIVAWLKEEYGLGRGHAMAIVYVIKNGAEIGDKHVGSDGVHRDESNVLRLDGKKKE
jgi:hypothetical protein